MPYAEWAPRWQQFYMAPAIHAPLQWRFRTLCVKLRSLIQSQMWLERTETARKQRIAPCKNDQSVYVHTRASSAHMWPIVTKWVSLKFGNLRYPHVSNLQVLLVILMLKSSLYSQKCGCGAFLKVACMAEAILRKSALNFHCALSSFSFNP